MIRMPDVDNTMQFDLTYILGRRNNRKASELLVVQVGILDVVCMLGASRRSVRCRRFVFSPKRLSKI
jgi:hypothetical protein